MKKINCDFGIDCDECGYKNIYCFPNELSKRDIIVFTMIVTLLFVFLAFVYIGMLVAL